MCNFRFWWTSCSKWISKRLEGAGEQQHLHLYEISNFKDQNCKLTWSKKNIFLGEIWTLSFDSKEAGWFLITWPAETNQKLTMNDGPADVCRHFLISSKKISQSSWCLDGTPRTPQHRSTTWTGSDLTDESEHLLYLHMRCLKENWPRRRVPDCGRRQGLVGKISPTRPFSRCSYLTRNQIHQSIWCHQPIRGLLLRSFFIFYNKRFSFQMCLKNFFYCAKVRLLLFLFFLINN